MQARAPALVLWLIAGAVIPGCSRAPTVSALDRQRLNRAWAYFLYAEADAQLARMNHEAKGRRFSVESAARDWVIRGLRQPGLTVTRENREIGGSAGFHAGINLSVSGQLSQVLEANPKAPLAETLTRVFNDAPARWDAAERLWHLTAEYKDDYDWARNQDRFKFPLAFYQDPFPRTLK